MFLKKEQERFQARDFTVSLPCSELELISKYIKIANQWKDENNLMTASSLYRRTLQLHLPPLCFAVSRHL